MTALDICILGGTGFVGHSITAKLAALRHNVTIISHRRERSRELLVLPTVQVVDGDVHNPAILRREFQGKDVVINLVGILNEAGRRGKGFERAHVSLPEKVVQACLQAGVPRLLHMSALHASTNAPSHYLRTKARGENLVHDSSNKNFGVTSFRPSVIFGPKDSFINRFAQLLRMAPLVFPLACPKARFQPVYVEDVAQAFVKSLQEQQCYGQRYDLCGPKTYSLREVVEMVAHAMGRHTKVVGLNQSLSWMQAAMLEWVPGKPFSLDNYHSLQIDSVCRGQFPEVFGITPRTLESVLPEYIGPTRSDRYSEYRGVARRN